MELIGYRTKISITQALPCEQEELMRFHDNEVKQIIDVSWLYDPFGENLTYGVEFKLGSSFCWDFFLFSKTHELANEFGVALLYNLQEKYRGLDGRVSVDPIYLEFLDINKILFELILPSNPPIRLHLLRKIINYYKTPQRKLDAHLFILWKRDNLHINPEPTKYMIRIFISLNSNPKFSMNPRQQRINEKAVLRYFVSDISIPPYQKASYLELSPVLWRKILTSDVFPQKPTYGHLPIEMMPNFINPNMIDFDIPHEIDLIKPPILENRNTFNLELSKNDPNFLYIGDKMNKGVLSTEIGLIEIDSLITHLSIFGLTGTGKSTLIKLILFQIMSKRPDVGILIINFAKPYLEDDYPTAEVYKFPSDKFRVPYITPSERTMISIKTTSDVLASCLGLKHIGPTIFSETLRVCYSKFHKFPDNLKDFFDCVDDNMKAKTWEPEYKQHVRATFKRRINELFYREDLMITLNLLDGEWRNIPDWFKKWMKGETILLDLTKCTEEEQHLMGMMILYMIDVIIPTDREKSNTLKYLLTLDEAHRLVGEANDKHTESPEFIMKNRTNSSFSRFANESRSKGLGIIIADQKPHSLLPSATDYARQKILFKLGYPSNQMFTGSMNEREMLLNLPGRYALVMTNTEQYLMRTEEDITLKS